MKRLFDIIASTLLLFLLGPLILFFIILIRLKLGNPVFFKQERPGLDGEIFTMIKFRTMLDAVDSKGVLLPDSKRMTGLGSLLRKTSIDEIPSLWNVLRGEMSLVGPRPLLVEYLPLYDEVQSRRHEIRPGITGWAQVNGRNAITWQEKFNLDVWYVDNQSFFLDLKILFLTILKVAKKSDISQEGHVTSEKFTGNQENE